MTETAQTAVRFWNANFIHDESALVRVKSLKKYFPVRQGLFARHLDM